MSDDIKLSRTRRQRPRVLVVNNPSPESSDVDRPAEYSEPTPGSSSKAPPALAVDLSPMSRPFPSPRSNQSNPALSSPSHSSTSSRTFESTPPPSTPGQSNHSEDLSNEGTLRPEHNLGPWTDDSDITPPSATFHPVYGSVNRTRPMHRPGHRRRPSTDSRAIPSPTITESQTSLVNGGQNSPQEKVALLVTTDGEHLVMVDVTGAKSVEVVREKIFTKLQIFHEDEQKHYSFYRTELGKYAIGGALTDEQLWALYREHGDAKASVMLMVSPSGASVHEQSIEPPQVSPTVSTIPPVLPQNSYPPLRPRRRSRSRRGSVSSSSERMPPEPTGLDDLDHNDRRPGRALPNPHPAPRQALPPRPRSPPSTRPRSPANPTSRQALPLRPRSPPSARPHSPPGALSPDLTRMQQGSDTSIVRSDRTRIGPLATPPSNSPETMRAQESIQSSNWYSHVRSGSDAALDRERVMQQQPDLPSETFLSRHEPYDREREGKARPRNPSSHLRRQKAAHYEAESESRRRGEVRAHGVASQDSWPSPSRPQQLASFSQRPPQQQPTETRERSKRSGKEVPAGFVISWKVPSVGGKIDPTPSVPQSPPYRNKMAMKSLGDMRGLYKTQAASSSTNALVSRSRPPASPLPVIPKATSSGPNGSDPVPSNEPLSSSYHESPMYSYAQRTQETPRGAISSPTNAYYCRPNAPSALSPQNFGLTPGIGSDPFPRPSSAAGSDVTTPPYRPNRHMQSPNGPDPFSDSSQHRPTLAGSSFYSSSSSTGSYRGDETYHPTTTFGPRPQPSHSRHERSTTETLSTLEYSPLARVPRTPPRSPISGRNTSATDRDPERKLPEPSQPIKRGLSSLPLHEDDLPSPSESTVTVSRREDFGRVTDTLGSDSLGSATIMPTRPAPPPPLPRQPVTLYDPPSSSSGPTLVNPFNFDDSDSEMGTIWAKPPPVSRASTKPVLAPIDTDSSPSSRTATLPRENSRPPQIPGYIPDPPAPPRRQGKSMINGRRLQDQRTSRFDNNFDVTWAPRPPPEEVLERLDEYFPEHDVDEPVIEAPSGGASPTSVEPGPTPVAERKFRHKKSIRVVAAERRRIDRTSHQEPASANVALRKRNTKLWGSRLEEVPTHEQANNLREANASDQSPGPAKPIFRWVRGELIGKGTYGKVYLALNATTGEMIAVKQVEMPRTASDKDDSRQISVVEALKLESETLKDLDHPHIVQYLGFEETPTFLSIFLEYVPGGSIASCLRKHGKFDEEVTKSFTGQILGGLEYLHSKGILHRDLKADNILVETTGICKISDFGISKRTDDINMAGAYTSMQGTVFWMAPEVIDANKKGYNSKIDIWSVGCVVFEMWTGQRPWNGKEAMAVLLQLYQTKQGPPVPQDVILSPLADDFREQCFAMNPDERPTASVLRRHPYLELQPDWKFTGFK